MSSENAARAVLVALLVLTLYLMYLIFKPFLPGIAWAIVLTVAFEPLYRRLVGWLRGREWTAAILLSALVAAFIAVPSVLAVLKVAHGIADAYAWAEERAATGGSILSDVEANPWVARLMGWVRAHVDVAALDLQSMTLSAFKAVGGSLAGQTRALVANVIGTGLTLIVLLVTMTVLFHEGPRLVQAVRWFLPLSEEDKEAVFRNLRDVTRSVFFGVLLTALVQAIVGAIGFAVVGLPSPITFGTAMFFCALLPMGTAVVWAPAALWLFLAGHPVKGAFMLVWGMGVVGLVDNFLRPYFIGRGLRMHMLLVFFGVFGGMLAFGLIGLFTGPLVITLFLFLMEIVRRDLFPEGKGATGSVPGP